MVTIYERNKSTLHQILSKLTCWSIDEMHAWLPYMKQKDKLTLHQNLSKLTGWSIVEMHAWSPYMKENKS